jgi:hypothetical protein
MYIKIKVQNFGTGKTDVHLKKLNISVCTFLIVRVTAHIHNYKDSGNNKQTRMKSFMSNKAEKAFSWN